MWSFKGSTILSYSSLAGHYDSKLLEALERKLGDLQVSGKIGKESQVTKLEEKMLLPKDLLKELEKMDEERMNEHLKAREDLGVLGLDGVSIAAQAQLLQNQQNSLMMGMGQLQRQQMFASAQQMRINRSF